MIDPWHQKVSISCSYPLAVGRWRFFVDASFHLAQYVRVWQLRAWQKPYFTLNWHILIQEEVKCSFFRKKEVKLGLSPLWRPFWKKGRWIFSPPFEQKLFPVAPKLPLFQTDGCGSESWEGRDNEIWHELMRWWIDRDRRRRRPPN